MELIIIALIAVEVVIVSFLSHEYIAFANTRLGPYQGWTRAVAYARRNRDGGKTCGLDREMLIFPAAHFCYIYPIPFYILVVSNR